MENPYLKAELAKPGGVAECLTAARTKANLSGRDLAQRTGFTPSKISKLELARQVPTAADVFTWLQACAAGPEVIREVQVEVERIRQSYPALQRLHRSQAQAALPASVDLPPATSLAEAYAQGYAAAIRDIQEQLGLLLNGPVPPEER